MGQDGNALDAAADELELLRLEARVLESSDVPSLVRFLAHPSRPVRLRAASMLSVAISADRIEDGLCEKLLANGDAEVRWSAAFASSRAGRTSQAIVDISVEALGVEDGDVRWAAASIVTREARESASLRERLRSLSSEAAPRSRKMALLCLCDCGAADGTFFRRALSDEDPFVRLAAVTCLARSGDTSPESIAALGATSRSDADARVRRGAAAILARLSPKAS